ncbi:hypothetical protein BgiBS90_036680, partial [Biomphalaria glabrata]
QSSSCPSGDFGSAFFLPHSPPPLGYLLAQTLAARSVVKVVDYISLIAFRLARGQHLVNWEHGQRGLFIGEVIVFVCGECVGRVSDGGPVRELL